MGLWFSKMGQRWLSQTHGPCCVLCKFLIHCQIRCSQGNRSLRSNHTSLTTFSLPASGQAGKAEKHVWNQDIQVSDSVLRYTCRQDFKIPMNLEGNLLWCALWGYLYSVFLSVSLIRLIKSAVDQKLSCRVNISE